MLPPVNLRYWLAATTTESLSCSKPVPLASMVKSSFVPVVISVATLLNVSVPAAVTVSLSTIVPLPFACIVKFWLAWVVMSLIWPPARVMTPAVDISMLVPSTAKVPALCPIVMLVALTVPIARGAAVAVSTDGVNTLVSAYRLLQLKLLLPRSSVLSALGVSDALIAIVPLRLLSCWFAPPPVVAVPPMTRHRLESESYAS